MKDTQGQLDLPGVPRAKQGRDVAPQWAWTEASVWTEQIGRASCRERVYVLV